MTTASRPIRRRVVDHPDGYRVDPGDFTTTDPDLAEYVAAELDKVDPLPCPHDGDRVEVAMLSRRPAEWPSLCQLCGRLVQSDAEPT